ncbi:MAG: PIG-L family deacetylase [Candidatus Thermoplasmatota archaeon]|nr:PIG-L family deacetylase [Candidatus Thermoplasmatota archaeon]
MSEKVLVIGAHPDDETYGPGGTLKLHSIRGDEVHVLVVTDGSSSQYENYDKMIMRKKMEARNAMKILGVSDINFNSFPDMKLDTIPHVEVNGVIENKVREFQPTIVYTHHWGDVNKDHRLIFESTMVAVRPRPGQTVRKLISYETPSSTEWMLPSVPNRFIPNMFVDISGVLKHKLDAVRCYISEVREYPHPRSPESVEYYARANGSSVGIIAAERFMVLREYGP